jgi:hypothetical protein
MVVLSKTFFLAWQSLEPELFSSSLLVKDVFRLTPASWRKNTYFLAVSKVSHVQIDSLE